MYESEEWDTERIKIRAVYADHGYLSPHTNGLLIDIHGIKYTTPGIPVFDRRE